MIQDVLHPLLETYGKPNDESEETFQPSNGKVVLLLPEGR